MLKVERYTSDSEWGSTRAEPVSASLTSAEIALGSMAGMANTVTSSLATENRRGLNETTTS